MTSSQLSPDLLSALIIISVVVLGLFSVSKALIMGRKIRSGFALLLVVVCFVDGIYGTISAGWGPGGASELSIKIGGHGGGGGLSSINGWGGGGSGSSYGGKPPRGSQVYLQDPWNHEHNYHGGWDLGPHQKHGWGGGHSSGHGVSRLPEQATYVQKLVPVLNLGSKLKRIASHLEGIHPHLKWQKPHLAFFGLDGSAHNVHMNGGHGGGWENDGWGYNHASHHIGHSVNKKPHYSTW